MKKQKLPYKTFTQYLDWKYRELEKRVDNIVVAIKTGQVKTDPATLARLRKAVASF